MTTARARMSELSGLSGVSARAHFLAITQGAGTGTVFVSRMTVSIEAPQIALIQRDATRTVTTRPETTDATKRDRPNRAYALTKPPRINVTTRGAEIFAIQRTESARFVRASQNAVTTRRKRKTAVI